ncbi:restriction endonuclease subunit S [Prevotella melaninogenica]|uniref:restriction endonuclease subunit S n=1 Tax=Prevotella melaninogenica TaxID=28132 RepID=UPI00352DEB47
MEEWKEYKLREIGRIVGGATPPTKDSANYDGDISWITPKDLSNFTGRYIQKGERSITQKGFESSSCQILPKGSILFSSRAPIGYIAIAANELCTNQGFKSIIPDNNLVNNLFLYYLLKYNKEEIEGLGSGTTFKEVSAKVMQNFDIKIPSIQTQKKIADILSSLDDKIELNRRINDNLEQQAQVLFNHYFVDTPEILGDCTVGNLTDIASYLNGLAMQKYRPTANDAGIPVLKIKELGQGKVDEHSDQCSENIDSQYKVDNGDIIFSWSGTLMVKIWCGGECGLNQHLFKVTSEKYPKWFYYFWTLHHLKKFIHIAQDKAVTMGHIKRSELEKSEVLIPSNKKLIEIDKIISPLLAKIIALQTECRNLTALRDTLLPKLMSGEVEINKINN